MAVYLFLYFSVVCLALVFQLTDDPQRHTLKKKVFLVYSFGAMFLLQALRASTVAADTEAYIEIFNQIRELSWNELSSSAAYEIGYAVLNKAVSVLSSSSQLLLALTSFIIMFGIMRFFDMESKDVYLSTILFMGLNHFFTSMSSLRQYIALALLMYALLGVKNKQYIRSLLFMIAATLFHQTSIIFSLSLIGLMIFQSSRKTLTLYLVCEGLILLFYEQLLQLFTWIFPKYNYYLTEHMRETEVGIGEIRLLFIVIELFCIAIVLFVKRYHTKTNMFYASLLSVGILVGLLQAFIPFMWRLTFYFDFILLIFIPELLKQRRHNQYFWRCIINVGVFSYFLYLLSHNTGVIPYRIFI